MAIPQHLEVLKQGVAAWNKWRNDNPGEEPDLAGAKLSKTDLKDANFRETDLRWADLTRTNLSSAFLNRADFRRANLSQAIFKMANLSEANLSEFALAALVKLSEGVKQQEPDPNPCRRQGRRTPRILTQPSSG